MSFYLMISLPVFVAVFIYMFFLWKKYGRDEKALKNVTIKTSPPRGITPAIAGYLYNNNYNNNNNKVVNESFFATIVDMAAKGLIKLEISEKENKIIRVIKNETENQVNEFYENYANLLQNFFENKRKNKLDIEKNKTKGFLDKIMQYIIIVAVISIFFITILFIAVFTGKYNGLNTAIVNLSRDDRIFQMLTIPIIIVMALILIIIPIYGLVKWVAIVRKEIAEREISDKKESRSNFLGTIKINKKISLFDLFWIFEKYVEGNLDALYASEKNKKTGVYLLLKNYSNIGVVAFFALLVIFISFLERDLKKNPPFLFISENTDITLIILLVLFLSAFIIQIFDHFISKKKFQGMKIYRQLLGFEKYLSSKEKLNLREATKETFEKYLPYAIALGVGKKWANRFSQTHITVPKWFLIKDKNGNPLNLNINSSIEVENKIFSVMSSTFAPYEPSF